MSFLHRLKHLLGLHKGYPFSFYDRGKLMMGFKCGECGDIEGIHPIDNVIDRIIHNQQN